MIEFDDKAPSRRNPFGFPADFHKNVKRVMQKAIKKLNDWIVNIAEQTAVDALETCDVDHNKDLSKTH